MDGYWGLAISGIIFVANAADIVGIYTIDLYAQIAGTDPEPLLDNKFLVMGIALLFIAVMTWVNYRGSKAARGCSTCWWGSSSRCLSSSVRWPSTQRSTAPAWRGEDTGQDLVQPFAIGDLEAFAGNPAGDLHLLGVGHRPGHQRGDEGFGEDSGPGRTHQHGAPARDLRLLHDGDDRLRGDRAIGSQPEERRRHIHSDRRTVARILGER